MLAVFSFRSILISVQLLSDKASSGILAIHAYIFLFGSLYQLLPPCLLCSALDQLLLTRGVFVQRGRNVSFKNLQPISIQGNRIKWQLCEKLGYASAVPAKCSSRIKSQYPSPSRSVVYQWIFFVGCVCQTILCHCRSIWFQQNLKLQAFSCSRYFSTLACFLGSFNIGLA